MSLSQRVTVPSSLVSDDRVPLHPDRMLPGNNADAGVDVDSITFILSDNIEWRQFTAGTIVFGGSSSLVDHLEDNLSLAGNLHNRIKNPDKWAATWDVLLSRLRQVNYRPIIKRMRMSSKSSALQTSGGLLRNSMRRLYLLWITMPQSRGRAENWAFFIYYPNWWFGRLTNILGYVLKGVGDGLQFISQIIWTEAINWVEESTTLMISGTFGNFILGAIGLIASMLAAIGMIPIIAGLWLVAQPFYFLSNTLNYLKHIFDALSNLWVSFMAWAITKRFLGDKATYTDFSYSLKELVKYTLLLTPLVLFILFSIIPFTGGPVGAFIAGTVLKVGITTIPGILNLAIVYGLMVGNQIYGAAIKFCVGLLGKLFSPATPPFTLSINNEQVYRRLLNAESIIVPLLGEEIKVKINVPSTYDTEEAQVQYKAGFIRGFSGEKLSDQALASMQEGYGAGEQKYQEIVSQPKQINYYENGKKKTVAMNLPTEYRDDRAAARLYFLAFSAKVTGIPYAMRSEEFRHPAYRAGEKAGSSCHRVPSQAVEDGSTVTAAPAAASASSGDIAPVSRPTDGAALPSVATVAPSFFSATAAAAAAVADSRSSLAATTSSSPGAP